MRGKQWERQDQVVMKAERTFTEILSLCLRSRCPVCAQGQLFVPLLQVRSLAHLLMPPNRCATCSFQFRRESGYYFGVLTPLLPIFSLATGLVFVATYFLWTRTTNAMDLLRPGAIGTGIGFILFFRPALAIFITLDHAVDPPKWPTPPEPDAPSIK